MSKTQLFVACSLLVAAPASAQSPFDGTWKMDPSKAKWSDKPSETVLSGGSYKCVTCTPAYEIKADGTYQKRPGVPDESSVQVISDRMIKFTSRKNGQLLGESLVTVAADGSTRVVEGTEYSPNGTVTRATTTQRRVGAAPAGAHMASGKWVMDRLNSATDEQMIISFKGEGEKMSMNTPDGYSYVATFGGAPAAVGGDRGGGKVQLRRLAADKFEEHNWRDGKLMNVTTFTRTANNRLLMRSENKMNGGVEEFEFVRQ